MRKFFIPVLFLLTQGLAEAQYVKEFSQDTSLYISELSSLFANSLMEDERPIFESFSETWNFIDDDYQMEIMEISELMRKRSCRPRPHYIKYIEILEEFLGNETSVDQFEPWLIAYRKLMENEKTLLKEISNVNRTIISLLKENFIYQSTGINWQLGEPRFNIVYEDGFRIYLEKVDMFGMSGSDFIMISEVTGYADPVKLHFYGSKGRVFWELTGLSRFDVFAELSDFDLNLKKPEYSADSVLFTNKLLLEAPALGKLTDRISQVSTLESAKYPQFTTYQSAYKLNNIVPGIDYTGAIMMQGANLAGTSSAGEKAQLDIFHEDTLRLAAKADAFIFSTNAITSQDAEISIYLENDSVYHPDLIFNYNNNTELLRLIPSDDYNSQGPYSDSYHRIDIIFDELSWDRNEPIMKMQAALGTAVGNALFESYDFFNMDFYDGLQGLEYQHPLVQLWTYAKMVDGNSFDAVGFAQYIGVAVYMIRQQLMHLSKLGFVYFDFDNDLVTIRPKLYDFIDASLMKRDYDVIRFVSVTDAGTENAILDLQTKDLIIQGIPNIFLSDSQNVKLVPSNNTIVMKRNRNFQFDGVIDAGLFKFYGKNFFFEYDNFLVNLQNIDSISISAITGERDRFGGFLTTTLENKIKNVTGELLIDAPFNKSGLSSFPEYPIFTSRENSYVYFDEKSIQDGVYDRNEFYFELFPFSIDSLDNFTKEAMKLSGTFFSAGILPDLEMDMTLRPDNSLGFFMTTEEEGIPVFEGRGTFYSDLEMSNAGLRGYGSLDYLSSSTWSDNFVFHPDSMMAISRKFLIREDRGPGAFPYAENTTSDIKYYPEKDMMHIKEIERQFDIYTDEMTFGGEFALQPAGLSGDGMLNMPDAKFQSDVFLFKTKNFLADSAGVNLVGDDKSEFTLSTNDVGIDVDLVRREGDFVARDKYTLVELPANLYEVKLNQITWSMDKDEVKMTQSEYLPELLVDVGIDSLKTVGPLYISNHPKQDSLQFTSPVAYFNYNKKILNAQEVPFLDIGDSYIFPDNKEVTVLEKASIKPLKKAKILTDKYSRYHLLYGPNLIVDSRNHFNGSAFYDYTDEFGDTFPVWLNKVEVDTSLHTYASGEIAPEDSFLLSPYFNYQGAVTLDAQDSLLSFSGGVQLTDDCSLPSKQWLKFETRIDPDSILIPVASRMQNLSLNNIYAGTLKARDSIHIYPTFLSGRKDYFDRNLTFSDGFLFYDKLDQVYEIADSAKLRDSRTIGNYLALETDSCNLYAEGELDLQLDYGRLKLSTYGQALHRIDENKLKIKTVLGMGFHFNPTALALFGNEVDSLPDLKPTNLTSDFYTLAVKNIVGNEKEAERLEKEVGLYGNYLEVPDSLNFSIMFNEVNLEWVQETRSYRCNGEVGIGMIGGVQVNKKVKAYMEFVERGSGDIFDIYLMIDDNTWYYMAYSPGGFQVLSSNKAFNEIILNTPDKERTLKSRGRQKSYIYSVASNRRLSLFRSRFLQTEEDLQE